MAQISYGSITIIDVTDIGQFSVYPRADASKTQIYNPDANSYMPNWDTTAGGTKVTISPVAYYAGRNVTSSATFTWQRRNGGGAASSLITGETVVGKTLEITKNVLADATGGLVTYVCTASYSVDGVSLQAIGQIDFSLVRQGSSAKVAKITGDNVFKVNSSGSFVNSSITLTANVNNVSISGWKYYDSTNGYVTYPGSGTGTTLTITSSDTPVTTANSGNGLIKIKLETNDNNTYDIFTITILKDGINAQSMIAAILSNEVQMLPANDDGSLIGNLTGVSTQLTIYEQGVDKTNEWTITKTPSTGITLAANQANNVATVTAITQQTLTGYVTFTCEKTNFPTFTKEFNIVKITAGTDGTSPVIYSLQPVALGQNNVNDGKAVVVNEKYTYNNEGTLTNTTRTPEIVRFYAYQQTGNTKTAYEGRIQFYVNGSSSISNVYNVNTSYRDYNFSSNTGTTKVKAVLYAAGANTTELDSQTIVVINDGSKGVQGQDGPAGIDAVNLIISNEADVIPCDNNGHPIPNYSQNNTNYFKIEIPFEGYQGTTKKVTTVTAPNLNSSIWGTTNDITPTVTNAQASTVGSVIYKIPVTATLSEESGTISLNFSVAAEGGNVLINNRIYSWTKSQAAENGENAVILTTVTPDGTVFENGSGILTIKGILYDGPSEANGVTYNYYYYNTSGTPGYVQVTSTSNSQNRYIATQSGKQVLKIKGSAVDGYGSFKVSVTYNTHTYEDYVSLIDKTDPLQISVHSTIGTQIKNTQGVGCLYVRVTRDGVEIDPVPAGVEAGLDYPTNPSTGDYFIKLTAPSPNASSTWVDDEAHRGSAILKKRTSSEWTTQNSTCQYLWTYRDSTNTILTANDKKPATSGQYVYIDGSLIQNKITADVQVTLND